jgi:hypothetical protein
MATKKPSGVNAISHPDDAKWRAEDDMRTLARAEEVKADPKRLAAAKKMAKEKLAELQSIAGLTAK